MNDVGETRVRWPRRTRPVPVRRRRRGPPGRRVLGSVILCYHAVNPHWRDWLSIPPAEFTNHAAWLARREPVDVRVLLDARSRGERPSRRVVAITFDDGFADLHEHALPILIRAGVPATVYLVAGTLVDGRPVDWVDDPPAGGLRTLTIEQVHEMQAAGVTFGSHTWSHPDLRGLDDRELDHELRRSREALEDLLGERVDTLAYPRGLHDARVRRAAERAGYRFALSLPEGPEHRGRYAVPRVGIGGQDGTLALSLKAHPLDLWLRMGPLSRLAGPAAELVRRTRRLRAGS